MISMIRTRRTSDWHGNAFTPSLIGYTFTCEIAVRNRPRSIYQYSNMGPRLSGLTSIFGVVFFVSKSPVGIERQKKLEKFAILTRKPRSHA